MSHAKLHTDKNRKIALRNQDVVFLEIYDICVSEHKHATCLHTYAYNELHHSTPNHKKYEHEHSTPNFPNILSIEGPTLGSPCCSPLVVTVTAVVALHFFPRLNLDFCAVKIRMSSIRI